MSKISYLAALILLLLSGALRAQAQNPSDYYEEVPRTFIGGLIVGCNFTQVDGDNYAGYHRAGLNAGGIVYANLGDHLAASLEILYSQKGSRSNSSFQTSAGAVITSYN